MPDFSRISVGLKTFLRDQKLYCAIQGIRDTMPEVTMIVADCGEHNDEKDGIYGDLVKDGHKVICLDFDAGFGAMSNVIADALDTPYLLVGSDDFDFRPPSVRKGIEEMLFVLENTDVDIASGRVRGPYEFWLDDQGDVVTERKISIPLNMDNLWYQECDLTVNYSLIKRRVFDRVRWFNDIRIGGSEHAVFFIKCKREGFKTAYIPGVAIKEQEGEDSSRYRQFRARANRPEREALDYIGVKKYVLGNGRVDYEKREDYPEPITR